MAKICKEIILIVVFALLLSLSCAAFEVVKLNDLVENGKAFDGKSVTVQGEAIGEAMNRGDYTWVNINDGTNAMGIWLTSKNAKEITYFGDYKHKGDTVSVTGTFNRACTEHGGDTDIHSSTFEIIQKGNVVKENINPVKIIISVVLLAVTIIVAFFYIRAMKKPVNL